MATTEIRRFAIRRGTAAAWTTANPVLISGEEGYETDTRKRKVGDGVTAWNSLPYDPTGGSNYVPPFQFPWTRKIDARASLGLQGTARPDSPLVIWALDAGQALPVGFIVGGVDPKYDGDTAIYVATA